jgi:pimeloyl-ACP methyl ester carboxylesterase
MPTFVCDGAEIFHRELGAGVPVLLVHGSAGGADTWNAVAEGLSASHRVIVYDRRGQGRSPAPAIPAADHYRRHGADAAALLRHLGAAPACVVGWSSGGIVALHLAVAHGALVDRLVLFEPPLHADRQLDPRGLWVFLRMKVLLLRGRDEAALEVFLRYVGGLPAAAPRPPWLTAALEDRGAILRELAAGTGAELTAARLRAGVRCPVTYLRSEKGPALFAGVAQQLARVLPSARVVIVPGGGHLMPVDEPARLVAALLAS